MHLAELKGKSSAEVHEQIVSWLQSEKLLEKISAFGSDGERALKSENGVAGKLKADLI